MTFEESLRRLAPIIGEAKANRLWRAYLLEDRDGQNDIYAWVKLSLEKAIGQECSGGQFLSLPSSDKASGKYVLGNVVQSGDEPYSFGLRESELIQHIAIFGRSGAGKTNTVIRLIKELARHNKPFMLFDWKRNYRDLLACDNPIPIEIYTVGKKVRPLRFNPLIPPTGTSPQVWLKKLIEIACNSFYLGEGVSFLLQDAIDAVYQEFGVYESRHVQRYPTMSDVLRHLQEVSVKGRKALWMDSALRALQTLCFGPISDVVNVSCNSSLDVILKQNAILELDSLANAEKVFFIESLMVWIHHFRLTERHREVLKHVIIVEEAHNILDTTEKDSVINTMMREIRELGECIVLVDQHPSQMPIPAMGNTYCTIALNVKHSKDIQALADAMQVSYKDNALFGQLPTGRAIVKLQARFNHPFLIEIPKESLPKGTVTDEWLSRRYRADFTDSTETGQKNDSDDETEDIPESRTNEETGSHRPISELEERFLRDVLEHPFDGIVRRYSRLNVSRRRGNAIREKLIALGALRPVPVFTKNGKVVLVEPSPELSKSLKKLGAHKTDFRSGGLIHRYWKAKLREYFTSKGWKAVEEKAIGDGHFVDIHVEKGDVKIGVEVEAGSRGVRNIGKIIKAGYDKVFSFSVNGHIRAQIEKELLKTGNDADRIILATPYDYERVIDNLFA